MQAAPGLNSTMDTIPAVILILGAAFAWLGLTVVVLSRLRRRRNGSSLVASAAPPVDPSSNHSHKRRHHRRIHHNHNHHRLRAPEIDVEAGVPAGGAGKLGEEDGPKGA
jgi:hypothetical protein